MQFTFEKVKFKMQLKMRKFHYFESKFHYLKVTCAVENPKNYYFESDYVRRKLLL